MRTGRGGEEHEDHTEALPTQEIEPLEAPQETEIDPETEGTAELDEVQYEPPEPDVEELPHITEAASDVPFFQTAVLAPEMPRAPDPEEVVYVPLAVTVGDGFKLGCGFFIATVLAFLIGLVLLAGLFALSSVLGVGAPLGV